MTAGGFPRALFDDAITMLGGGIGYDREDGYTELQISARPPRLRLANGTCSVEIVLSDDEPRSSARTDEEHALVERLCPLIRESVDEARERKAKVVAEFGQRPLHDSATFGRAEFGALVGTLGTGDYYHVELGDVVASIRRGDWERATSVSLLRGDHRVTLALLDGTLRTTAATDADRALVDEAGRRVRPVIERLERERAARIVAAVAGAPEIDRDVLVEALTAITHGRVDVQPIADAVVLSTTDPRRYVVEHAHSCSDFGIDEPVEGLHVIALLSHIPSAHLAYFDWKTSTHTMVQEIADLLRAGPGVTLAVERYRARCDAWDRARDRIPPLKQLAAEISGAALVELKQSGDAYAIACIPPDTVERIRAWSAKAHVPLRSLVVSPKATKKLAKELANATDVRPYAATARFAIGELVEHPTFGRGKVIRIVDGKVVVQFGDRERTLLHGKT
jgi:hypothetical protein